MDAPRRSRFAAERRGRRRWRVGAVAAATSPSRSAIVAGGIAFWLMSFPSSSGQDSVAASPAVAEQRRASGARAPAVADSGSAPATPVRMAAAKPAPLPPRRSRPPCARGDAEDSDPTTDISVFVNPGEAPTMAEVIERLHQAGVIPASVRSRRRARARR